MESRKRDDTVVKKKTKQCKARHVNKGSQPVCLKRRKDVAMTRIYHEVAPVTWNINVLFIILSATKRYPQTMTMTTRKVTLPSQTFISPYIRCLTTARGFFPSLLNVQQEASSWQMQESAARNRSPCRTTDLSLKKRHM